MYNTIVIGGGAGGLTVSIGLASAGKKVLLVEKDKLGGECTWGGCIPSKSFITVARTSSNLEEALEKVVSNVHKIGDKELPHISKIKNLEYVNGEASFIDKNTVSVNGKLYRAKFIVISTGSLPFIPEIKGLKDIQYLTNQNFFYTNERYKSIVMLGAGIISLELAFPLRKLGVDITILEKTDLFLPMMDKEVREFYIDRLKIAGVKLILGCEVEEFVKTENEILIKTSKGEFKSEKVFVAIGRKPNLENLNLDKIGLNYSEKGIVVDKYMRTSINNIFGIGDVVSQFKFSHVAGYHGEIVVRNILFSYFLKRTDLEYIPSTIFGDIEVSRVGLTEEEARKKFKRIYVYKIDENNDRSIIAFEDSFLLKVICDRKFNIIGVTCIGERAGEIVGFLQNMINNKMKFYKVMKSIQAYPTYCYYIRNLAKISYIDYLKSYNIFR
ncbi:MAG: dihydrolipoyl dehydrogenase family protein [Cetobacterium sp.]